MYASHQDHLAATGRRTVFEALVEGLRVRLERHRRQRDDSQAMTALASMDAHLLRDIGADRADLARLVREGRD